MIRVAVAQVGSRIFNTKATLSLKGDWCRKAREEGVQLLVFPEAYIGGYPKGLDFGARIGSRTSAGREDYLRYFQGAIEVPGEEVRENGRYAASMNAYLVVGVIERDARTLYCTALYFGPNGELLNKRRKLMPSASERLIWGFGDGSTIGTVNAPFGRFAAAICWENYMPSYRMAMHAQGIRLWCAPTVDDRDIWQATMRHIAYEGRCFVLSVCQFMTRAHAPEQYDCIQGDEPDTVLIAGGGTVISPLGEVVAGPMYDCGGLLVADIDPEDCERGKFDLDVAGHYERPDVFRLEVDTTSRKAVSFRQSAPLPESSFDESLDGVCTNFRESVCERNVPV
ncbi:carbon-nitrogen hydrolase family protein [Paraburkholderia sp. RL18-103-BIB-C]|uniref:carbon-nitrogen hydrolase family protein n=1 Tax=unclassified Paraburkholderia TaxID=2615204 RepID=UPI0038BD3C05